MIEGRRGPSVLPLGVLRLGVLVLCTSFGCAAGVGRYRLPAEEAIAAQYEIPGAGPQFERGRPNVVLDGLNHYVLSLPAKLMLWDWQVLDHEFPPESERLVRSYLETNRMRGVKVRHNQYAPFAEFGRLVANEEVGAGYRYTLGIFSWLRYTLLPDRLFAGLPIIGGGDHFNPFSNTVNVYSSDPGVLLHETGHAKDYLKARWKGTRMGLLRLVPFVDLWQEAVATDDAIGFLKCEREIEAEIDAYKVLFPAYATYISGYVGAEAQLPLLIGGHVAGRIQASRRNRAVERAYVVDDGPYAREVLGRGFCAAPPDAMDPLAEEASSVSRPAPAAP